MPPATDWRSPDRHPRRKDGRPASSGVAPRCRNRLPPHDVESEAASRGRLIFCPVACKPARWQAGAVLRTREARRTAWIAGKLVVGIRVVSGKAALGDVTLRAGVAERELRFTLFHELHHQARGWVMRGGARRTTFMDGPVCEGLASAFERDAAGRRAPWAEYPPDVEAWVHELMALPRTARYAKWMFRHPDGRR
jgi:hypothetical protein